ncbi:hypothetical protein ACQ86N_04465 [Puia sp. P3]|uniref:hypothetical protein n=1 Tax=Puia sp. P3 TaxID=3423952 RepID=UPI003D664CD4
MTENKALTRSLHAVLFLLFSGWLYLFVTTPVRICPDSYGYFADADHLFEPGYQTIRPVLFPLFLRVLHGTPLKMSIVAYLLNCGSLLYMVKLGSGKARPLFSRRNTIVLISFLMLIGIWSYCGTYLTESILFAVQIWIFIFLYKIVFPIKAPNVLAAIGYALAICLLATTLKPWIMIMVLLTAVSLFIASLAIRSFRSKMLSSFILLVVAIVAFGVSMGYNRSKSFEKANIVVFMAGSGFERTLQERLTGDKSLNKEDSSFLAAVLSDMDLILHKYDRNPWDASKARELRVLNVLDPAYGPGIDKAYRLVYFQRFRDFMGLVGLAFERHISDLRLDTSCFEIAYGPELPGLRNLSVILIVGFAVLLQAWNSTRPDPSTGRRTGLRPIGNYLKENRQLSVFIGVMLLSGIIFSLLLTLAGAFELKRTNLPSAICQAIAIAWIVVSYPGSAKTPPKTR